MTHTPTRRLLALLLAVATVFSLLSMSVSAADEQTETQTLTLTADKDVLKVGDTVTITVKVSNNATIGFSNFELAIDYDTTLLKLEHINKSYKSVDADGNETDIPYLTGFYTVNTGKWVDPETGKEYIGYINFANTEALTNKSPKTIFTLDFTVLKCESENTSVTLDKIAFNSIEDGETVSVNPTIVPVELSVTHTLTAVPAKDATCTEDGNTAYWICSACEKWFSDENGTTEITDKDSVVKKATGHSPSETWSYDSDYHWHICTTCNAVLDKAAHSGGTATCQAKAICDVCKAEYGTTTAHTFISKHDDTQHWKECSICGAIDSENPKTNHTFGEWETVTDSTCTATGTKKHTCTGCDYSETGVIEKKAHTTEHHDRVDPTCTTTGSIEYWQCGVCGKMFSDAACTTEVTDVTLDKLPHSAGTAWEKDTAYHWHLCTSCGSEVMDKAAHTYGDWVVITEATETETGLRKRTCSVCGYEQTEEIGILRFTVTVRNGSGSGEYKSGETVTITADRRSGYTFEKWTVDSGNVTLAKETDSTTIFTMPAENVTVTAAYRYNGGSGSGSGSSSGIVIKDEKGKALGKADPDTGIVELPIPPVPAASSSRQAEELEITIPKNTTVKVEIPVRNVTPGTVVVIVHADGTEEIVRTSIVTKNGVALELTSSATVKVYDNSKFFSDVPAANWASDAVAFASSRELFNGTGANTFSPNAPMTRQMLMTVLARLDGTDTSGNAYAKGMEWAIRNGVSNGSDPEGKITREQLATMLWRYAGSPSVSGRMTGFVDADQISGYAEDAILWATKAGIIGGKGNGQLDPKGYATRAEVAAMLMRYCNTLFTK